MRKHPDEIPSDFYIESAFQNVPGYTVWLKFGRNSEIDTTTDPEDVWHGGGHYTGHDATAEQDIEVLSGSANDTGTVVTSGTATGGSSTTLINTGDTFVTDTVAVGDLVINDTQAFHGVITAVDSETQVTVFSFVGSNDLTTYSFESGDSYRIVTPGSTGAAVVRWSNILNGSFVSQLPRYSVMNGATGVTVAGSYMRCDHGEVVLAGSSTWNEGNITCRQATTTANVFCVMPAQSGQTQIACGTIPAGKCALLAQLRAGITRASGAAGSAQASFRTRRYGEAFRSVPTLELSTGGARDISTIGIGLLPPGTDFKLRIDSVSDNDTICDASFKFILKDI